MVELGDPDVLVDLHDQNLGHPPMYQPFGYGVNKYIQVTAELATVHELRHDGIRYMAAAFMNKFANIFHQVCQCFTSITATAVLAKTSNNQGNTCLHRQCQGQIVGTTETNASNP